MKHEAMQDIGEVDSPLIFVPLPVRISQRFVDTGNSSVSHLTTKMQKEVCEVFHKICYILELEEVCEVFHKICYILELEGDPI